MSAYQFEEFERRMNRINRRHTKLSRGYTTEVTHDGLVVAKPSRPRSRVLLRTLIVLAFLVLLLKTFSHAYLGAEVYDAQVLALSGGNAVERVGAWVMSADPITQALSAHVSSFVR